MSQSQGRVEGRESKRTHDLKEEYHTGNINISQKVKFWFPI